MLAPLVFGTVFLGAGLVGCNATSHMESMAGESVAVGQDDGHMNMDLGPADDRVDLRFIDAMVLHHEGAVLMAEEALEKTNRSEIRVLAEAIIEAQAVEIAQMRAWRTAWYPDAGAEPVMFHAEMNHEMAMSEDMRSAMMMAGDLGAADDTFDLRFLNAMIPHHEGALVMAQEILEKSDRPEVRELAEAILETQEVEINQMQEWKQSWYGE